MRSLLDVRTLNQMRRTLYGQSASLTFYKMTPATGETPVLELTSGWHAQRNDRKSSAARALTIWVASAATEADLDSDLHTGAKVTIICGGRTQSYRINGILPMAQIGAGWVLECDPAETSTDPDNG
jgi:hypothetical protein